MEDCLFCKIVSGQIPCHKVYEDEHYLAFLDIRPYTMGHTLVVPKLHYRWVYDVNDISGLWKFTNEVALKLKATLDPDFITILTIGNEVPHAHIHLIPRYQGDNFSGLFSDDLRLSTDSVDFKNILTKINS